MKKISILVAILPFVSGAAFAGSNMNHNNMVKSKMNTESSMIMNVSDIQMLADDARIVGKGYIKQNMGNGVYVFEDSTGKVMLDIEDNLWGNMVIGPNDMVVIYGEVDRDGDNMQIEVDKIRKM